ncbi:MAG: hypothetical protein ACLQKC_05620, partial [Mycobacterium sp.]
MTATDLTATAAPQRIPREAALLRKVVGHFCTGIAVITPLTPSTRSNSPGSLSGSAWLISTPAPCSRTSMCPLLSRTSVI